MSKLQLKKELAGMDREQLAQIILDAYSARKEMRAYFEFFLNPDVDRLKEKYLAAIGKELQRRKHRVWAARITVVRRAIREFASFDPGAEYVLGIMLETIRLILQLERVDYLSEAFEKGTKKLVEDTVAYADAHLLTDTAMSTLHGYACDSSLGTASFRNRLLMRFMWQ